VTQNRQRHRLHLKPVCDVLVGFIVVVSSGSRSRLCTTSIAVTTTRQTVHELLQHADTVRDPTDFMDVDRDAPCRHPLSRSEIASMGNGTLSSM
jgi:hypothetical protein